MTNNSQLKTQDSRLKTKDSRLTTNKKRGGIKNWDYLMKMPELILRQEKRQ